MKKSLSVIFLLISAHLAAQPYMGGEQANTRYRDNELPVNPAFAGTADRYFVSLGVFKQWTGIAGAPLSENLQFHIPCAANSGVGAWLYNETFAVHTHTQFGAAYAYTLKLGGNNNKLALGLNFAVAVQNERIPETNDPDPLFTEPIRQVDFNAGFGAFYFTDKYYAGFSVPRLKNDFDFSLMHYYFTGGYRFDISKKISITPSALAAVSPRAGVGYECVLTAAYDRRFEAEVGIAAHSCLLFAVGIPLYKDLALRYQYSQNFGSDYHQTGSSHFIVLRFSWDYVEKVL
ncbi:MAG: PorP/SprF family type IX secretion system membrane protein [Prevotellaceae bacterium]|jgi:type IX secretion system PorP/SprF family membrane protein|nr:PorP/SprF family type IX secretion system membrane protein [Prevotellaceae bacterium]